ncbi:MAG: hypothetical protein AB7T14_10255 [Candidatus Methylacidiphilaceae bacterium]
MPEEEKKQAEKEKAVPPSQGQAGQPGPQAATSVHYESYLANLNEKLDQAQKDLGNVRNEIRELRLESRHLADHLHRKTDEERRQGPSYAQPLKEWDEYAHPTSASHGKGKTHAPSPHHPPGDHESQELGGETTPLMARNALHRLHGASREAGGRVPKEEKQIEREFGRLQHERKEFFDQTSRVVKDTARLQHDQRFHPERTAKDEERLRHDWLLLRKDKEAVQHDSQRLGQDAARLGKEHPGLRREAWVVAREAHREGRDLPPVHTEPLSHRISSPPSHAQTAMEALREKAKGAHSPTCLIVTQAGRHVHIFESTRKDLLALHKKYGEDLLRLQKDGALHPEEWKRLRDDRKRIAHDQGLIHKDEQILGKETRIIGPLTQEIGKEDASLRKSAQTLNAQVQAEVRDSRRFLPTVPPGHSRSGGRDR